MPKGAGKVEQRRGSEQRLRSEGWPGRRVGAFFARLERMPRAVALAVRGETLGLLSCQVEV